MFVAFDSNVFIFALDNTSPKHKIAQRLIRDASASHYNLVLVPQNLTETYRVITSKKIKTPFSPDEATGEINRLIRQFELVVPNDLTIIKFLEYAQKFQIVGFRTFDAFLAVTLISNGIEVLYTDNAADFKVFSEELTIINPFHKEL